MKSARFDYLAVETVEEAAMVLSDGGPDARLIAGGQSLVPMLNFRLAAPSLLIDIGRVRGLDGIAPSSDGGVEIGATTRTRHIELSTHLRARQPLLNAAVPHIAHLAIRNRGTIGGSLAHADPAAEFPALAVALGATISLHSRAGKRKVGADDFFQGVFMTAARPDEVLTAVHLPEWPAGRRWGFREYSRRRGDFALSGVALWADLEDGTVARAGIVAFGVSDTPQRLREAEAELVGSALHDAGLEARVAEAARAALAPDNDLQCSSEYRKDLTVELLDRALGDVAREPVGEVLHA